MLRAAQWITIGHLRGVVIATDVPAVMGITFAHYSEAVDNSIIDGNQT